MVMKSSSVAIEAVIRRMSYIGGLILTSHIRDFNVNDIEDVVVLMRELGYPTSVEVMRNRMQILESLPDYHTFIADLDGRAIGLVGVCKRVLYESDDTPVQIAALVTHSQYRGMGIGKSLVQTAERWALEAGAPKIFLTSGMRPERSDAHEFYKNLGYDITGYRFVKKLS